MGKVVKGDMLEVLRKHKGEFDFCFADAPFNLGQAYQGFDDRMEVSKFKAILWQWALACWTSLKPDGVLALHGNDLMLEEYLAWARNCKVHKIAHVIWHFRFGQCGDGNWINSHCHCLIFAKDPKSYTWNPDAVLVESDRSSTYGDPRIEDSSRGGKRVPLTVWGVPSDGPYWGRVQANNKERRESHPNQLPCVYLERLIRAYTNIGDKVVDPFGGSGTTAVVAKALNRDYLTIDISEANVASIKARLRNNEVRIAGEWLGN